MNENLIQDVRKISDMRMTTFSGYKKTEVKKALTKALKEKKYEHAFHWCSELICSGSLLDIWILYIQYSCQNIYLGNPKLFIYLEKRLEEFRNIMRSGYSADELMVRNNDNIRKIFIEMTTIIIMSNNKHSIQKIKIETPDFVITNLSEKFKANHSKYAEDIYRDDDPRELYMACNEMCYHLLKTNGTLDACYWAQWIVEFEIMCKKKKIKCHCEVRSFIKVENKYNKDCVWLLWDIFLFVSKKKGKLVEKIINSLLELFMVRYSASAANTRKIILYCCISFLTEYVNPEIPCVQNELYLKKSIENRNVFFKEIKKNEQKPDMSYLFNNKESKESNLEKTLNRLKILKNM